MRFVLTRTSVWECRAYIDRKGYEEGDAVNPLPKDDRVTREIVEREKKSGALDRVEMFFIEIDSIEELAELEEEVGSLVIGNPIVDEVNCKRLEIYDDYRE